MYALLCSKRTMSPLGKSQKMGPTRVELPSCTAQRCNYKMIITHGETHTYIPTYIHPHKQSQTHGNTLGQTEHKPQALVYIFPHVGVECDECVGLGSSQLRQHPPHSFSVVLKPGPGLRASPRHGIPCCPASCIH